MNNLYQKRIIAFMWAKHKKLKRLGVKADYMCKKIEEDILKWKDKDAERVYKEIKEGIISWYDCGLSASACPYCVKIDLCCNECFYEKINGKCYIGKNIFSIICNEIEDLGEDTFEYPDNKFYRRIINNIEREIK